MDNYPNNRGLALKPLSRYRDAQIPVQAVRVLHIEDTPIIARAVEDMLEKRAVGTYTIHLARSQADGLAWARENPVDVVLLDLGLPDSRGPQGVRAVRDVLPDTPIIVLSSDNDAATMRLAYEAGADVFLDKVVMGGTVLEGFLRLALAAARSARAQRAAVAARDVLLFQIPMFAVHAIALHHNMTSEHARRVAEIAVGIAERMDLSSNHVTAIWTAGMLHDVGKISIPTSLLDKREAFTDEDRSAFRDHPDEAFSVASQISWPWPIPDIIRQHHERMNGSGYPDALSGDRIMVEARILAVADAFDARVNRRDVCNDVGIGAALSHIREGSGTLYDPVVVQACCRLFADRPDIIQFTEPDNANTPTLLLLIDDETLMGRSIRRMVQGRLHVSVNLETDGVSGISTAKASHPALILLDIRMPGMDGLEVLRCLKHELVTQSIPVIMLTAVNDEATRRAAIEIGADDYIVKPVEPEELIGAVTKRLKWLSAVEERRNQG